MTNNGPESFNVAVVGGGIVGLHVALGLLKRNIPTTVFERTTQFREIGAGLGFPKVAVECMRALDPRIADAFDRIAASSTGNLRWADGYTPEDIRLRSRPHDYEVNAGGPDSFPGCHCAQLLDGLVALVPPEALKLNKELDNIEDRDPDEKHLLRSRDGTTAEADVVIGCDGIKSRVRRVVIGDAPAAHPQYSHQVSYRALLDMGQAVAAVGDIVRDQLMYMGPGAHINTYPVAGHTMVNVVAFVHDPAERGGVVGGGVSVAKGDVFETFAGWGPVVRALVALLPDRVDSWAIYDTHDHPLSTYAHGRIALAGDAAHGASPHHGAGASMGVEDALCLATALAEAAGSLRDAPPASRHEAIAAAIRAHDAVRRERTQRLVRSSRAVLDMFQQSGAEGGRDGFQTELSERSHRIWDFDWRGMVRQTVDAFNKEQ
ncbi:salicylate 1-monooxygenase SalA [Colletotrichum sojae]|uniref:Salicylate 1-monooxygenase SalA n=1 Tax=Colletotrichum sojae TaxID=2175907 RepID=A0A8H6J1J6_9PEZI|nr:salicylate 1-monooxygenase SalA [Colletotrichum sojae]